MAESVAVQVEPEFLPYVERALMRIGYLFPDVSLSNQQSSIVVAGAALQRASDVARQLRYQLYRERIFAETRDLRFHMIKALTE